MLRIWPKWIRYKVDSCHLGQKMENKHWLGLQTEIEMVQGGMIKCLCGDHGKPVILLTNYT